MINVNFKLLVTPKPAYVFVLGAISNVSACPLGEMTTLAFLIDICLIFDNTCPTSGKICQYT